MNAEYINAMDDKTFADEIMLPQLIEAGLIDEGFEADEAWVNALAAIVRPRTKMPADAATVAAPVFKTAETLEYDEKSVAKGLAKEGLDALAAIVRPRTKMPADAATVAAPVFKTAETLEYDEKSVAKGLAKEGLGAVLGAAKTALEAVTDWTPENIDAALEPLPEALDVKKRRARSRDGLDAGEHRRRPRAAARGARREEASRLRRRARGRVRQHGNMVSPPLGETMALIGRDDCLARIDRARPMAL